MVTLLERVEVRALRDGQQAEPGGPTSTVAALRRSALFATLAEAELAQMSRLVHRFVMAPGVIFREGDSSATTYVLVSGRVDIAVFSADGRELLLYRLGPGDFFGELALLDDQPRGSTALARSRCELLAIGRAPLLDAITRNPQLALGMIVSLAGRLRTADETIKAVGFLDMSARLARTLLAVEEEQAGQGVVRVGQHELASAVGCTRQSVTRTLAAWRQRGYITTARGCIRLLDRPTLQAFAEA